MNKVIMNLKYYNELIDRIRTLEEENMIIQSESLDTRKELEFYIEEYCKTTKEISDLLNALAAAKNLFTGDEEIKCYHIAESVEIAKYINENYKEEFLELMKGRNN
jgi:hypothetical protein